jgi:MFS family permease
MRWGFWTAIAGASVLVLVAVLVLVTKGQLTALWLEENKKLEKPYPEDQVRNAATFRVWLVVIGSVLFGVLAAWLAARTRDGYIRSRTWYTVVTALTVLYVMFLVGGIYSLVGAVLVLTGCILFFTPTATSYLKSEH